MAVLSIITFPAPIFPTRCVEELELPEVGRLRRLHRLLHDFNQTELKVYSAVLSDEIDLYLALSDHAAFMYKRKGQIVQRTDGTIILDGHPYKLATPQRLKIYAISEIDCKIVRRQATLQKLKGIKMRHGVREEDDHP